MLTCVAFAECWLLWTHFLLLFSLLFFQFTTTTFSYYFHFLAVCQWIFRGILVQNGWDRLKLNSRRIFKSLLKMPSARNLNLAFWIVFHIDMNHMNIIWRNTGTFHVTFPPAYSLYTLRRQQPSLNIPLA